MLAAAESACGNSEAVMPEWVCPRCTFSNQPGQAQCEMCDETPPAACWTCAACKFAGNASATSLHVCRECGCCAVGASQPAGAVAGANHAAELRMLSSCYLLKMGFDHVSVKAAVEATGGALEASAQWLLDRSEAARKLQSTLLERCSPRATAPNDSEAGTTLQGLPQCVLNMILYGASRGCDEADYGLVSARLSQHVGRRLLLGLRERNTRWLAHVGDLCHGLHESAAMVKQTWMARLEDLYKEREQERRARDAWPYGSYLFFDDMRRYTCGLYRRRLVDWAAYRVCSVGMLFETRIMPDVFFETLGAAYPDGRGRPVFVRALSDDPLSNAIVGDATHFRIINPRDGLLLPSDHTPRQLGLIDGEDLPTLQIWWLSPPCALHGRSPRR